jgi:hypothetical protein
MEFDQQDGYEALARLLQIARRDTGQSRRVADFLLAWHNAEENGGWDPTDLWNVDPGIAEDIIRVLRLVRDSRRYPGDLGFEPEISAVWRTWLRRRPAIRPRAGVKAGREGKAKDYIVSDYRKWRVSPSAEVGFAKGKRP